MNDNQPLYEVDINYGEREFATICFDWKEIEGLLRNWQNGVSSITAYGGWHREWVGRQEAKFKAYLWLIPKTITSITAEELPEPHQATEDEQEPQESSI